MAVVGINHVTLCVSDLERSIAFYTNVLGFAAVASWSKGAYLEAGQLWLALILNPDYSRDDNEDYSHIALTCQAAEFETLSSKLEEAGVREWPTNLSEGNSKYFCDPDGHQLEIHVGDLKTRLSEMRKNPWEEIKFF